MLGVFPCAGIEGQRAYGLSHPGQRASELFLASLVRGLADDAGRGGTTLLAVMPGESLGRKRGGMPEK